MDSKENNEWVLNKDEVKGELLDTPVEESIRMTESRDKWRKYIHGVANPRIEHG